MVLDISTCDPGSGFVMCIHPTESRRKRSAWIMWICEDGSAHLYDREESGAVLGDPVILPANISRAVRKKGK